MAMMARSSQGILLMLLFSLCYIKGLSQEIRAIEGSFGVDTTNKMIVWHEKNIDSIASANGKVVTFIFDQKFEATTTPVLLSYTTPIELKGNATLYTLYITKLPLIQLKAGSAINANSKIPGIFTYFNNDKYLKNVVGIEYRGNLSLTFPKKSFDLEFWSDSISKKPKDIKFKGLRNDDDWILDGLYNEPLRIRSTMAAKLWPEIYKPNYLVREPKAKSGFRVQYVEVFENNRYIGLYSLSEPIDRKQLSLKEGEGNQIRGELFKAAAYEGAPSFKKAPDYDNLFPHWGGFEMKFPILAYRSHWDDVSQLVRLVVHGSDAEFSSNIEKYIDIDNAIDYFLFVNLLRATDNLGKNYYLARYDRSEPYFFVPWDLDGVFGIIQEGKRIATTDDMLSNGLFDKLLRINPNGLKHKLKTRWLALREAQCSDRELFDTIEKVYARFTTEKIYQRELRVWTSKNVIEDDYSYLNSWLKERLIYLDQYFENL